MIGADIDRSCDRRNHLLWALCHRCNYKLFPPPSICTQTLSYSPSSVYRLRGHNFFQFASQFRVIVLASVIQKHECFTVLASVLDCSIFLFYRLPRLQGRQMSRTPGHSLLLRIIQVPQNVSYSKGLITYDANFSVRTDRLTS